MPTGLFHNSRFFRKHKLHCIPNVCNLCTEFLFSEIDMIE
jgi:hypothetical protein